MKNGRMMGLNECELNASTSPLRIDDADFAMTLGVIANIPGWVDFFIYCLKICAAKIIHLSKSSANFFAQKNQPCVKKVQRGKFIF